MSRIEGLPGEWERSVAGHYDHSGERRAVLNCAHDLREALPLQYAMTEAPPPVPGRYLVWAPNVEYADGWAWECDDWDGTRWHWTQGATHWRELPEGPKP